MRGLKDKVVVIAGGVPGNIGGVTAERLAEEGCKVVVADLNELAAKKLAVSIEDAGGTAFGHVVDISDEGSYKALIDATVDRYGGLDCLFNVAADLSPDTLGQDQEHDITSLPIGVWQRTFDVTLTGYLYGIRHALPVMYERGGGSIVNTMSAATWMNQPIRLAYSAAKSAVHALTQHTATIAGKRGVRCNSIAPGVVLTSTVKANVTEDILQAQLQEVRSPRLGQPEDIASTVAFLFSDDSAWLTAQAILVDGGMIRQR